MAALDYSAAATELEQELKDLFMLMYNQEIKPLADDINVYGVPHLGSFELIERNVEQDGIVVLRETSEERIRYLYKAWKHLNPERGFHFLRTYLTALFGTWFEVNQLYQEKVAMYPLSLKSLAELGGDNPDYFLTSRVRVDVDTDTVPDRLIQAFKSVIAARFVLQVRIAKFSAYEVGADCKCSTVNVADWVFDCHPRPTVMQANSGIGNFSTGVTVAYLV